MNFVVWRRGLHGPVVSLDLFDPRQSADWKIIEQTMIDIITLSEREKRLSFAEIVALHPCPEAA